MFVLTINNGSLSALFVIIHTCIYNENKNVITYLFVNVTVYTPRFDISDAQVFLKVYVPCTKDFRFRYLLDIFIITLFDNSLLNLLLSSISFCLTLIPKHIWH